MYSTEKCVNIRDDKNLKLQLASLVLHRSHHDCSHTWISTSIRHQRRYYKKSSRCLKNPFDYQKYNSIFVTFRVWVRSAAFRFVDSSWGCRRTKWGRRWRRGTFSSFVVAVDGQMPTRRRRSWSRMREAGRWWGGGHWGQIRFGWFHTNGDWRSNGQFELILVGIRMRIVQVLCQLYAVRDDSAAAFQHTRPVVANKIRHWIAQRTIFNHRHLGVLCLFQLESVLEKV